MDGNLHAGPGLVKKDPNKQNQNGKIFMEFLERNPQLTVLNALNICEGMITRSRNFENKIEDAVLDFYVVNEKILPFVKKMQIDENKQYGLINLAQLKQNKRFIESDHNALLLEIEINDGERKPKREEIYNFRNRVCQEAFRLETENNEDILKCFENNFAIDKQFKNWKHCFDNILKRCFKKIRITPKKVKTKTEKLLKERFDLKKEARDTKIDETMREEITKRIEAIENDIGEEVAQDNFKVVADILKDISDDGDINGSGRKKMWATLKTKFPKISKPTPVAKKDKSGKLISKHEDLRKLYLKTYKQRMRDRPMKEELIEFKNIKEDLFEKG